MYLWEADNLCKCLLRSTERLVEFPRLYEAASQYGEGVRRIGLAGQNVLYEIHGQEQLVKLLASGKIRNNFGEVLQIDHGLGATFVISVVIFID